MARTKKKSVKEYDNEKSTKDKNPIYVIDSFNKKLTYWGVMIDLLGNVLPTQTNIPCWGCRSKFNTCPIGCPIKYTSILETRQSESKDDKDSKFERVSRKKTRKESKDSKPAEVPFNNSNIIKDLFDVEGIFCSFCCVKSFIHDQKSTRYKNSYGLLTLLYSKVFGKPQYIPFAPDWKTLKKWGGFLTIEEFRASFGNTMFIQTVNTKMFSSSQLYFECKTTKK